MLHFLVKKDQKERKLFYDHFLSKEWLILCVAIMGWLKVQLVKGSSVSKIGFVSTSGTMTKVSSKSLLWFRFLGGVNSMDHDLFREQKRPSSSFSSFWYYLQPCSLLLIRSSIHSALWASFLIHFQWFQCILEPLESYPSSFRFQVSPFCLICFPGSSHHSKPFICRLRPVLLMFFTWFSVQGIMLS